MKCIIIACISLSTCSLLSLPFWPVFGCCFVHNYIHVYLYYTSVVCTCNVLYVCVYNVVYYVFYVRSKDEEKSDVKKYAKKSSDVNKKKRILSSMTATDRYMCIHVQYTCSTVCIILYVFSTLVQYTV